MERSNESLEKCKRYLDFVLRQNNNNHCGPHNNHDNNHDNNHYNNQYNHCSERRNKEQWFHREGDNLGSFSEVANLQQLCDSYSKNNNGCDSKCGRNSNSFSCSIIFSCYVITFNPTYCFFPYIRFF